MTKTLKITLWIMFTAIFLLATYSISIQSKVKAWNELIKSQERVAELEQIIEDAQFNWAIAETSKAECIQSREDQKQKAHDDAEKARLEIKEIKGFLWSR